MKLVSTLASFLVLFNDEAFKILPIPEHLMFDKFESSLSGRDDFDESERQQRDMRYRLPLPSLTIEYKN